MTAWDLTYCPYCGKKLPELQKDTIICSCGGIFQTNATGWCISNDEDVLKAIRPIDENVQCV